MQTCSSSYPLHVLNYPHPVIQEREFVLFIFLLASTSTQLCIVEIMANCLFCASVLPTNYTFDGEGKITAKNDDEGDPVISQVCKEDLPIEEHLNTIFILRKVLNIPTELIAKFLSLCEGDSHPELWIKVCFFCMEEVSKVFVGLKQVSKLERRIERIREGLRQRIINSKDDVEGGSYIWKGIRNEAMKNTENIPDAEPPPPPPSSPPPENKEVELSLNEEDDNGADVVDLPPPSPPKNDELTQIEDDDDNDADEMEIPLQHLEHNAEAGIQVNGVNQIEDDNDWLLEQTVSSPSSTSHSDSLSVSDLDEHRPPSPIFIDLADSSEDENEQDQGAPPRKRIAKRFMDTSNADHIAYTFGDKRFFECRHCAYHGQRSEWLKNHSKAHEEGSGAVTCKECYWLVLPSRMPLHYRIHHKGIPLPDKQNKSKTDTAPVLNIFDLIANKMGTTKMIYQCSECDASFTCLEACKAHAKRHIKPTYDWCQEGKEWLRRPKVRK